MSDNFEQILDLCIDRVHKGESIEACLKDYPEYASELKPLLTAMLDVQEAYDFTPSDEAVRAGRQRFYAALEKQNKPSFWQTIFARRLVVTTAISLVALILIGYLGLKNTVFQPQNPVILAAAPSIEGNFAFLVSDEVNAIGEFNSLNVTIAKVVLQQNKSNKQIEFTPETKQFDLTLLPGDLTQQLWRGNVPEGEYSDVTIHVSHVAGVLKSSGETIELKLPSEKLQMKKPFQIGADTVTSFTYDLTVVKAGNAQDGGKYLLKPQINDSGASHTTKTTNSNGSNPGKTKGNSTK